jgi:hypothetical protein
MLDDKSRYSTFKSKEVNTKESKAMISVDSMVDWTDDEEEQEESGSANIYSMIDDAGNEEELVEEFTLIGVTSQVQNCPFGCHNNYAELKKEFDDVESQYKEYYIQVQAYKSTLQTLEK